MERDNMDEADWIYGRPAEKDEMVIVKVSVPRSLKVRLETLKMKLGRNLQDIAADALREYLEKEISRLKPQPATA